MLVTNTNLSLSSAYSRTSTFSLNERLALSRVAENTVDLNPQEDTLTLSDQAKAVLSMGTGKVDGADQESSLSPQASMLKSILEKTLGVSIGDMDIEELALGMSSEVSDSMQASGSVNFSSALYSYQQAHSESSQTSLSMQGTIRTSDGQELAFDLDISMSKSLATQTNVNVQAQVTQQQVPDQSEAAIQQPAPAQAAAQEPEPIRVSFDGLASDLRSMAFSFAPKDVKSTGSGLLSVRQHGDNEGRHLGHDKRADHDSKPHGYDGRKLNVTA